MTEGRGMADRREFILASASPRRSEILDRLGILHRTVPARIDEAVHPGESAEEHVVRLARGKAAAVAGLHPGAWVLAGDTVVVAAGEILGKPSDTDDAVRMLLRLAGRDHLVISALALVDPKGGRVLSGRRVTRVRFRSFDEAEARAYAATGEPMDKAGGYGIQGRGAALVQEVSGDYSGVVGLPVSLLVELLDRGGRPYRFGRPS